MGSRLLQRINGIAKVQTYSMQVMNPAHGNGTPCHMAVKTPCGGAACCDSNQRTKPDFVIKSAAAHHLVPRRQDGLEGALVAKPDLFVGVSRIGLGPARELFRKP